RAADSAGGRSFAVGAASTVLSSQRRWRAETSPLRQELHGISAIDAVHAVAVGADALLAWSGSSWSAWPTAGAVLRAVRVSGKLAVAVGDSGAMRALAMDGSGWSVIPPVTGQSLGGVDLSGTEAIAVGAGGVIVRLDLSGNTPAASLVTSP